jgi:hypothetical protein
MIQTIRNSIGIALIFGFKLILAGLSISPREDQRYELIVLAKLL